MGFLKDFFLRVVSRWERIVQKRRVLGGLIFYGLLFVLVWPVLGTLVHSNDIFKALYSGRYLWWFNDFPHHSTFTFNPVLEFLRRDSFNWLGNLALYGIFELSGYTGLQVVRGLIVLFVVGLIHSLFDWDRNPIFLILFFFVVVSLSQKLLVRTALVAVPGMTLLFWIGLRGWRGSRGKLYWCFSPIILVWSQVHGSYLLGLGVLILFLFGNVVDRFRSMEGIPRRHLIRCLMIVATSILAVTFVKPFPDYSFSDRIVSLSERVIPMAGDDVDSGGGEDKQRSVLGRPSTLPELSNDDNTGEVVANAQNDRSKVSGQNRETNTGANQDGSSYYRFIKDTLQTSLFSRQEFRSAEYAFPFDKLNFLFVRSSLLLGALGFVMLIFGIRRHVFAVGLPFLIVSFLGAGYLRTVGYLGILPVFILAVSYRNYSWFLIRKRLVVSVLLFLVSILLGISIVVSVTGAVPRLTGIGGHEIGYGRHQEMSPEMSSYILKNYPEKRFFNSYGLGSYLVWRWWPHKKVFVDTKWSAYHPSFQQKVVRTPLPETLRNRELNYGIVEKDDHWDKYFRRNKHWALIRKVTGIAAHFRKTRLSREGSSGKED